MYNKWIHVPEKNTFNFVFLFGDKNFLKNLTI